MGIEWRKIERGECEKLKDVPEGATVVSIDDKLVVAFCEGCSNPIFDEQEYVLTDDDAVYLHVKCAAALRL